MKENLNFSPKSEPSIEERTKNYNDSLLKSVQLAPEVNALMAEDKEDEYEQNGKSYGDLWEDRKRLSKPINDGLNQRVLDLKIIRGLKTFNQRINEVPELKKAFERDKETGPYFESSDEYKRRIPLPYLRGLLEITSELGYESVRQDPGNWSITFKKGNREFTLWCKFQQEKNNVGGKSRISNLKVIEKIPGEELVLCESEAYTGKEAIPMWKKACEDMELQKEIDLIVATLG